MDVLKEYWVIIAGFLSGVIWLVRLEAKANQNTRDIARVDEARKDDNERHREQRREDLERIEKTLTNISDDVKQILQRGS